MNLYQKKMPNDPNTILYIRKGSKSSLYGLAAHTSVVIKTIVKGGKEKITPSQSSLYLGYFETFGEAYEEFKKVLPTKVINWK